jgi:hypothetical protein
MDEDNVVIEYNPTHFTQLLFLLFVTIFFFTIGIHYFLKYPQYQYAFAKAFILLIIVFVFSSGLKNSLSHSDELWQLDDGGLELTILNAAHTFSKKGFTSNCGLPDFSGSYYYRDKTNNRKLSRVTSLETPVPYIYTHQPPGSSWLTGLFVKVCGNGSLSCPRILSTITSSMALLFFQSWFYQQWGR